MALTCRMKVEQLFAEFLGTFLLLISIFFTGNWLTIGLTLAGIVWTIGGVSGGHVNPAVSFAMYMKPNNTFSFTDFVSYSIVQILGGVVALFTYRALI